MTGPSTQRRAAAAVLLLCAAAALPNGVGELPEMGFNCECMGGARAHDRTSALRARIRALWTCRARALARVCLLKHAHARARSRARVRADALRRPRLAAAAAAAAAASCPAPARPPARPPACALPSAAWYAFHSHLDNYVWSGGFVAGDELVRVADWFTEHGLFQLGYRWGQGRQAERRGRGPAAAVVAKRSGRHLGRPTPPPEPYCDDDDDDDARDVLACLLARSQCARARARRNARHLPHT